MTACGREGARTTYSPNPPSRRELPETRIRGATAFLAISLLFLGACRDSGSRSRAPEEPADIHRISPESPPDRWAFTGDPILEIGDIDGSDEFLFNGVRGIRVDARDRLWVVDGGSAEIRVFQLNGSYLFTAGGRGEGPGEFQAPNLLGTSPGDTVLVWDYRLARLTLFTEDLDFVRTETPRGSSGMPQRPLGLFPDGSFLTRQGRITPAEHLVPGQVITDSVHLQRTARDFSESHLIVEAGTMDWIWTGIDQVPVPFTAGPRFAVVGPCLAVLPGPGPELAIHDFNGTLLRRFGVDWPERKVTDGDRRDYRGNLESLQLSEAFREDRAAQLEHPSVPDRLPSYDLLVGTPQGEIWTRRYRVTEAGSSTWDVFTCDGKWIASAEFPEGFLLYGADRDRIYGVFRDGLGVEHVRLYPRQDR